MEKPILQLRFHLRKPYNAAKLLIEAFNEIIEEGGRTEICILNDNPEINRNILTLNFYRCRNTYHSTSFGASITDDLSKEVKCNISKFNFASAFNCPTHFDLEEPKDSHHGGVLTISVFSHNNSELNKMLKINFETIDSSFDS